MATNSVWRHRPIHTMKQVRDAAQLAIQVEFTTIPAYLTAMYSIIDVQSPTYQAVRSVVVEEMYHLIQVADLLVGIGGKPVVTGKRVPTYPTYLPSANKRVTPYVGLFRASPAVFSEVFMAIETPAPYTAPAEGQNYATIGQLYKALEEGLERCVKRFGEAAVFRQAPDMGQLTDVYLGKFGGRIIPVVSLDTAKLAIKEIVEQGEGAVSPTRTLVPEQPWGTYEHYGERPDGTYGPILGTPYELSHYFKFMKAGRAEPFPDTHPIVSNPRPKDFSHSRARQKVALFDRAYSLMLDTLEESFQTQYGSNLYFKVSLPIMHEILPALAEDLMGTPALASGNANVGPNAAPTFLYHAQKAARSFSGLIDDYRALADSVADLEGIDLGSEEETCLNRVADRLETLRVVAVDLGFPA